MQDLYEALAIANDGPERYVLCSIVLCCYAFMDMGICSMTLFSVDIVANPLRQIY